MIKKVAFIGLGLIGGSLAKRIREFSPKITISALARSKATVTYALQQKIIDYTSENLQVVVHEADLVIIATPLELVVELVKKVASVCSAKTIILDVASTKKIICQELKSYSSWFIGGHPMAGTEKTGIQNADANILNQSNFILTPYKNTLPEKLNKVVRFIKQLRLNPIIIEPAKHDEAVAAISHLPYFAAAALLLGADNQAKKNLAATGFKSTTRVAESDPEWGIGVAESNKSAILKQLKIFQQNLSKIHELIDLGKYPELLKLLKKSRTIRRSIYP